MDSLAALRLLTALDLPRRAAPAATRAAARADIPWAEVASLAVTQGIGPLVAYNMEYRLTGGGAPDEVRDALLGYYHGTLTDNVYKLIQLKKLLVGAEDVPVVLIEAAAYADALYPHVAFRPLPELRLLARRRDFPALALAGQPLGMRLEGEEDGAVVLSDGRTQFRLHEALFGTVRGPAEDELFDRGVPAKAFGPRVRRPRLADALLTQLALMARKGFASPLIEYVDLRELVRGSPSQQGTWEGPIDVAEVKERAQELGLTRTLWCAMRILAHFFPEVEPEAASLTPEIPAAVRAVLEAGVVLPSKKLDRTYVNRVAEQVRKALV